MRLVGEAAKSEQRWRLRQPTFLQFATSGGAGVEVALVVVVAAPTAVMAVAVETEVVALVVTLVVRW